MDTFQLKSQPLGYARQEVQEYIRQLDSEHYKKVIELSNKIADIEDKKAIADAEVKRIGIQSMKLDSELHNYEFYVEHLQSFMDTLRDTFTSKLNNINSLHEQKKSLLNLKISTTKQLYEKILWGSLTRITELMSTFEMESSQSVIDSVIAQQAAQSLHIMNSPQRPPTLSKQDQVRPPEKPNRSIPSQNMHPKAQTPLRNDRPMQPQITKAPLSQETKTTPTPHKNAQPLFAEINAVSQKQELKRASDGTVVNLFDKKPEQSSKPNIYPILEPISSNVPLAPENSKNIIEDIFISKQISESPPIPKSSLLDEYLNGNTTDEYSYSEEEDEFEAPTSSRHQIEELRIQYLEGKISGISIYDKNGIPLIDKGQVITADIVKRIDQEGKLPDLILNMVLPNL